jgi:hypothetical protein
MNMIQKSGSRFFWNYYVQSVSQVLIIKWLM